MDKTLESLKEARKDGAWIEEQWKDINEKYEGMFIAVKNKKVLASAKKTEELIEKVEKQGINSCETLFEWIPPKGKIIIY